MIDYLNEHPKPLAVYWYGDKKHADSTRLLNETSSGAFSQNECILHSASHYAGFGGVGDSGYGRYGGFVGYTNFSNRKGILLKPPTPAALR